MKKFLKQNKAITLIALVITIIVLLILAGVTIATLTGDNGLLQKAKIAKVKKLKSEAEEILNLEIIRVQTEKNGRFTILDLYNDFKNENNKKIDIIEIKGEEPATLSATYTMNSIIKEITVVVNGYTQFSFTIDKSCQITQICGILKEKWNGETDEDLNKSKIIYNSNGGSGKMNDTSGRRLIISKNQFIGENGKEFICWNTSADGTGTSFNEGDIYRGTEDIELYAIWGITTVLDYPLLTSEGIKNCAIVNPTNNENIKYILDITKEATVDNSLKTETYDGNEETYNIGNFKNTGMFRVSPEMIGKYITVIGESEKGSIYFGTYDDIMQNGNWWYKKIPIPAENDTFTSVKRKMSFLIPEGTTYCIISSGSSINGYEAKVYEITSSDIDETNYKMESILDYPILTLNGWYNSEITSLSPFDKTEFKLDIKKETTAVNSLKVSAYDNNNKTAILYNQYGYKRWSFKIDNSLVGKYLTVDGSAPAGYIVFMDENMNEKQSISKGWWKDMIPNPVQTNITDKNSWTATRRLYSFLIPAGTKTIEIGSANSDNAAVEIYEIKISDTDQTEYDR